MAAVKSDLASGLWVAGSTVVDKRTVRGRIKEFKIQCNGASADLDTEFRNRFVLLSILFLTSNQYS